MVESSIPVRGAKPKGDCLLSIDVPHGTLRYYVARHPTGEVSSSHIVAYCGAHRSEGCRLQRTTLQQTEARLDGRGRCIGFLLAWLECGCQEACTNRREHVHEFPNLTRRRRKYLRRRFALLPGAQEWFDIERPRRPGESDEPKYMS